jgi:hypothetical protein
VPVAVLGRDRSSAPGEIVLEIATTIESGQRHVAGVDGVQICLQRAEATHHATQPRRRQQLDRGTPGYALLQQRRVRGAEHPMPVRPGDRVRVRRQVRAECNLSICHLGLVGAEDSHDLPTLPRGWDLTGEFHEPDRCARGRGDPFGWCHQFRLRSLLSERGEQRGGHVRSIRRVELP